MPFERNDSLWYARHNYWLDADGKAWKTKIAAEFACGREWMSISIRPLIFTELIICKPLTPTHQYLLSEWFMQLEHAVSMEFDDPRWSPLASLAFSKRKSKKTGWTGDCEEVSSPDLANWYWKIFEFKKGQWICSLRRISDQIGMSFDRINESSSCQW